MSEVHILINWNIRFFQIFFLILIASRVAGNSFPLLSTDHIAPALKSPCFTYKKKWKVQQCCRKYITVIRLCSEQLEIIKQAPSWITSKHLSTKHLTRAHPHAHHSPLGFSQVNAFIFLPSLCDLQVEGTSFLLINFKPKERSEPRQLLSSQKAENKIWREKKHPWKTANSASQPVIHQGRKVAARFSINSFWLWSSCPESHFYRIRSQMGPSLLLSHLSPNSKNVVS